MVGHDSNIGDFFFFSIYYVMRYSIDCSAFKWNPKKCVSFLFVFDNWDLRSLLIYRLRTRTVGINRKIIVPCTIGRWHIQQFISYIVFYWKEGGGAPTGDWLVSPERAVLLVLLISDGGLAEYVVIESRFLVANIRPVLIGGTPALQVIVSTVQPIP